MKNMTSKSLILAGAVAVGAFSTAQAIPITGEIDMNGTATLDSTYLGLATQATSITGAQVGNQLGNATGSFAGTQNDSVTWKPFSWPGGSATPLWTFTDIGTGWTYAFNLTSDAIVSQDNSFLNLSGTGTLSITGAGSPYDSTDGSWAFTISNPSGGNHQSFDFTFANSQTAVPDGGATVMLLGAALSAMALIRRKLTA